MMSPLAADPMLSLAPGPLTFSTTAPSAAPDSVTDEACALCERVLSYLDEERRLVQNNMVRDAVDDGYLAYADRTFEAFRQQVEGEVRALRARAGR